jgi:hypothetical protein
MHHAAGGLGKVTLIQEALRGAMWATPVPGRTPPGAIPTLADGYGRSTRPRGLLTAQVVDLAFIDAARRVFDHTSLFCYTGARRVCA